MDLKPFYCVRKTFPNLLVCQVPLYWLANKGIVAPLLEKAGAPAVGPRAEVKLILIFTSMVARPIDQSPSKVGERAQLQETRIGEGSVISNKTSLNQVFCCDHGQSCTVERKPKNR